MRERTMTLRGVAGTAALAVAMLMAGASGAEAQLNAENFAKLGFNFNAPGARSAALGGAFIPLADDATAAETNPAGLTVLLYPQVSFEFKGVEYTRMLPAEAGGSPDGGTEFTSQVPSPSFVSASLPLGAFTLAAFRHELVNYRSIVASSGYDFGGGVFLLPFTSDLELDVYNYGGAVAMEFGGLSVGVSGGLSQLDMDVDFPRYEISQYDDAFLANRLVVGAGSAELDDDGGEGTGFFVNGGVMYRFGEFFSLGGVYKVRPKFDELEWRVVDRRGEDVNDPSITAQDTFSFKIPDAFGGGFAVRPHELFTISVDALVNKYSQIAANDALVFTRSAGAQPLSADDYVADDGVDIHAGAEYILFLGTTPLALRGGASQIAASNTYYIGTDPIERQLWGTEPEDATLQFSAGVGTVLFQRFQFDGAVVMGEDRREAIGSIVFFF